MNKKLTVLKLKEQKEWNWEVKIGVAGGVMDSYVGNYGENWELYEIIFDNNLKTYWHNLKIQLIT